MTTEPRGWLGAAWLTGGILIVTSMGCASGPSGPTEARMGPQRAAERHVLVVLPPRPEPLWARQVQEIAYDYSLGYGAAWTMRSLGELCAVYEIPPGRQAPEVARRLAADPRVRLAQPVHRFRVLELPYNDPYVDLQHGVRSLRLPAAHGMATGRGVTIALVDTGVDIDHPDLRGRVVRAGNFVDQGEESFTSDIHGTALAGIIAATANNNVGIVGVAPRARLVTLKACWQEPPASRQAACDSYTLALALDSAIIEGAQVLNLSLTGPEDALLRELLERALEEGIVVVAAADEEHPRGGFPASLPGVLAVHATDLEGQLQVPLRKALEGSLAAPGVEILATTPRGGFDFFSGSSVAAAHVTGVVALLLEAAPNLTPAEVSEALLETARPVNASGGSSSRLLDACAALERVSGRACHD